MKYKLSLLIITGLLAGASTSIAAKKTTTKEKSETKTELKLDDKPESKIDPKTDSGPDPKSETSANPKKESKVESKPETKEEPKEKEDSATTNNDFKETKVLEGPAPIPEPNHNASTTDPVTPVPAKPSYETAEGDKVSYLVPYKPKALGMIPPRWRVEEVPEILVANDSVKLNNGTTTTLRVNAYRIVPNRAEGVVSFREPSFDPELGINQKETLSVILAESSRKLQESERMLERTASSLEETIVLAAEASKKLDQEKAKSEASRGKITLKK